MAQGRRIPEVLSDDERQRLLEQPNPRYPTGERNLLLMQLMLDTGLRLSEAINLKWNDINLMTGQLKVRQGKGAKDRVLWIDERGETMNKLRSWRERQADAITPNSEYVFTTLAGSQVSPRYVQQMVKRLAGKALISKDITPHTLRHTFATDLYRNTKNIRLVQKALGHSDLSTTMIYTHIVDDEMEEALKGFRRV